MAGRHALSGTRKFPRAGIIASAAVAAALVAGGTVGAVQFAGTFTSAAPTPAATSGSPTPTGSASATGSPTPTPDADRSADRASRGNVRRAAPSPTKPKPRTTASGESVKVVGSGSCGASFYDEGQMTANGEQFDPEALTAAHKTLAFNTRVRVTNPDNGKSVIVRINDRGPYVSGRCLDLSRAAFRTIADLSLGAIQVRYEILGS